MKITCIGDIHGRTIWKQIVEKESDSDKFIFVGDYFDSKDAINAQDQISNFDGILDFKRKNPHKVILLFGNHDFHYLPEIDEQYSGFQEWSYLDIREIICDSIHNRLVEMCYMYNNFIFSHAGITKTWAYNNVPYFTSLIILDVIDDINNLFYYKPSKFKFTPGKNNSMYGDDITQSPIWVRPKSLLEDGLNNFIQVVGHTQKDEISIIEPTENNKRKNGIVLIDALHMGKYLVIKNGKLKIESI